MNTPSPEALLAAERVIDRCTISHWSDFTELGKTLAGQAVDSVFAPKLVRDTAIMEEMAKALTNTLAYLDSLPDAPRGSVAEVAQCGARYECRTALAHYRAGTVPTKGRKAQ